MSHSYRLDSVSIDAARGTSIRERIAALSISECNKAADSPDIRRRGKKPSLETEASTTPSVGIPTEAPEDQKWQGVSAGFLRRVRDELFAHPTFFEYEYTKLGRRQQRLPAVRIPAAELTTFEFCEQFIKPKTLSLNSGYHMTAKHTERADATVFVSHAWKYSIADVLDQLLEIGEREPQTFFWFDILMVDQNNAPLHPKEFWTKTFKSAITSIGRTIVVLSPWNDPVPLKRAWCLYELYCTMTSSNTKLEIALPASQKKDLKEAVLLDPDALLNVMMAVDAEEAECFLPEDREMIFSAIRSMEGGFHGLNINVKSQLRLWALSQLWHLVMETEERINTQPKQRELEDEFLALCREGGNTLWENSEYDLALECYEKGLKVSERLHGRSPNTAQMLNNIGGTYNVTGKSAKALEYYRKALAIYKEQSNIDANSLLASAQTLGNMGIVLGRKQLYEEALEHHLQAKKILQEGLKLRDDNEIANCFNNLGGCYRLLGDVDKALEHHTKALEIRQKLLGPKHINTSESLINLGNVYLAVENYASAEDCYRRALTGFEAVLGKEHPMTIMASENLSLACHN